MQSGFRAADLEKLFHEGTGGQWHTELRGGAEEPWYRPATECEPACLFYTRDYFRSALHEVAHWCIAGPGRRRMPDFGYWYEPDGRSEDTQARFQQVERLPQALELLFCAACGHDFCVSLDNLDGQVSGVRGFEEAVHETALSLVRGGRLPVRAASWVAELRQCYRPEGSLDADAIDAVFISLAS